MLFITQVQQRVSLLVKVNSYTVRTFEQKLSIMITKQGRPYLKVNIAFTLFFSYNLISFFFFSNELTYFLTICLALQLNELLTHS